MVSSVLTGTPHPVPCTFVVISLTVRCADPISNSKRQIGGAVLVGRRVPLHRWVPELMLFSAQESAEGSGTYVSDFAWQAHPDTRCLTGVSWVGGSSQRIVPVLTLASMRAFRVN